MTDLRKAAQQALEALKLAQPQVQLGEVSNAITALRAALAQPDVPEGYVLVPVEPTQAMLDANGTSILPEDMEWLNENARQTWQAMLAAAPKGGA